MSFSPSARRDAAGSQTPLTATTSRARLHAPRRCRPALSDTIHLPSPPCAASSPHIWPAPSPDAPAACAASYNTVVLACVYDGRLYGYIDRQGREAIPPFFEDARAFSEGLAAVKLNGVWGYIHPDASTAIPIRFTCERGMAGPFREGLARVARNGKWGHIDREGHFVVEPRFDMAHEFSEGMADVTLERRTGYVNRSGELVIPPRFLWARRFSEGLSAVNIGSGQAHKSVAEACEDGFINTQGDFAISPAFQRTGTFQHGLCLVETESELQYIDRCGKPIWCSGWVELGSFDPLHLLPPEA